MPDSEVLYPLLLDETGKEISDTLKQINYSARKIDAEYASQVEAGKIDTLFKKWWAVANDGSYTKTQLLERFFDLLEDDKLYGVKTYNFDESVSSDGVLLNDSVALGVCTPATEISEGVDNFKIQPAFWTKEINYEIDADGEIEVKAIQGVDEEFSRDGTAGMVGVAQKKAYEQEYNDGTYNIYKYSTTHLTGFKPRKECVRPDGSLRSFMVHAKYMGGMLNGKPTSASGLPAMIYDVSHNSQITKWRTRGANYAGISGIDLDFRIKMFQLKYAKKGNSGVMEGCTNYNYDYTIALAESNVERVLLTTAQGANLIEGSYLSIGASSRSGSNALPNVRIKAIKTVTIDGTDYSAVYVDNGGVLFSTLTTWHVCTIPWGSGSCDNVLSVDGSPNNTNGKYPFIIQGLETQIGAYAVVADIIGVRTLTGNNMNIAVKMCRLAKNIATAVSANYYDACSFDYTTSGAGWKYIQDLIQNADFPAPRAIGGSAGSSNGCKCALYDPYSSGTFEWRAWAALDSGGLCGLSAVYTNHGLTFAYWALASGAPGSAANRGEWTA